MLVVGAGITGIYQLYRALEAGFTARLLEAGDGVGGTWYWNRYPGARFDSESYTYGYLFSRELFEEWEWQEHFAAQPETERYLNHVVDRFGLREHMRFGARVTSADYDEGSGSWHVVTADGPAVTARFVVAATGVLSVPYLPDIPGRDEFAGEMYHTGRWPEHPVDLVGKRVAVVGTSSSGVQVVAAIAGEVASLTVYQRTPNWCTPLNNRPITPEEQAELRAGFEQLREILNTSVHGFHHAAHDRTAFEDSAEERQRFYERMWNSPGFTKLTSNYLDLLSNPEANAEWCEFIAGKIRGIVHDPETAERLIPKDHRFGEKRPPFVAGYFEAFNRPNVSLVDLRETPMVRITPDRASRRPRACASSTSSCGPPASTSGPAPSRRWASAVVTAWPWSTPGPTARRPSSACRPVGSPICSFRAGPTPPPATTRATTATRSTSSPTCSCARDHGFDEVEVSARSEERWTKMIDRGAASPLSFGEKSYYYGTNIPGKPKRYLLNSAGRPKFFSVVAEVVANDYDAFVFSGASEPASATP